MEGAMGVEPPPDFTYRDDGFEFHVASSAIGPKKTFDL